MNRSVRRASMFALISLAFGCAPNKSKPAEPPGESAETVGGERSDAAPVHEVTTEEVVYTSGDSELRGYLAYPKDASGKRPGVLVVHEWWGLNDYVRSRARKLAEQGYVALAVDMYGEGKVAEHPQDAEKFMMAVMGDRAEGRRRIEAAKSLLESHPRTESSKLAAIGYCMGGALALSMARAGDDLDLVGVFHASLGTDKPLKKGVFNGKIFVAHGGSDPFVPEAQLDAFRKEMADAEANVELVVYPEAKHGFTNPGASELGARFQIPLAYDAHADEDSWTRLLSALSTAWN